jgi:hypothetical protein
VLFRAGAAFVDEQLRDERVAATAFVSDSSRAPTQHNQTYSKIV